MTGGYSRNNHSPQVAKRQASIKPLDRPINLTMGPRIEGYLVKVPKAGDCPELERALVAKGFWWSDWSKCWNRSYATPMNGKVYTAAQWIDWARRHYAAAWDWFKM